MGILAVSVSHVWDDLGKPRAGGQQLFEPIGSRGSDILRSIVYLTFCLESNKASISNWLSH